MSTESPKLFLPGGVLAIDLAAIYDSRSMASLLKITQIDSHTVALEGELDGNTAPAFTSHYAELPPWPGDIILDLSKIHFMDSMGLRVLIELNLRIQEASRRLILHAPSQPVVRVIEITGLGELLNETDNWNLNVKVQSSSLGTQGSPS